MGSLEEVIEEGSWAAFPLCQEDGGGRRLEVMHLVKPVSFHEDAKEWGEEAVGNLRHESNTPRIMWGTDRTGGKPLGL